MARLRLREVSESEEGFYRLERAMRYGKRLKLAKRVPRDVFMPEDKKLWFLFERIYRVIHDKEVAVLRRFGLTPMQYNVLEFVYVSSCKPTLGFIVDELRVSYGNLFAVVKNLTVNDTLRMYKNDDIRMYNFNCITDTIVEVITTCNTYTLLTVHLL